jgi:hypothetical protein
MIINGIILITSPCYLDDILIYSTNDMELEAHVQTVLQCLRAFGLHCKAKTCQFGVREVGILSCVTNPDVFGMESDHICTMDDWPTPESVRDVHMLLCFTIFYRRFSPKHATVMAPISTLLKTDGSQNGE